MPAKLERPERVYPSLKDFYAADERRIGSGEVDFGVMWGEKWPHYRVSWIEATGEVYAFEHGPSAHVVVLGYAATRNHVDEALEGWYDHCHGGVAWVEYQLQRLNEEHPSSLPRWVRG